MFQRNLISSCSRRSDINHVLQFIWRKEESTALKMVGFFMIKQYLLFHMIFFIEQRLLAQYEDIVHFDEERLCAAIDLLSTDAVTCPICKKYKYYK